MDKRFNLIDEPWIPVADKGRASLRQLFSDSDCRALGIQLDKTNFSATT